MIDSDVFALLTCKFTYNFLESALNFVNSLIICRFSASEGYKTAVRFWLDKYNK